MIVRLVFVAACLTVVLASPCGAAPRADGQLTIEVTDADTGRPIAARIHLKNARGRPLTLRLPNTAEFGGHFYIDGKLTLPLRVGRYTFELDAGPEYRTQSGHFEIERHADDTERIEMKRFANLAEEGWYGGDLDFRRTPRDVPLVLRAEGLKDVHLPGHVQLLDVGQFERIAPDDFEVHVARAPYAWNLPVWLAQDALDGIQLIDHRSLRDAVAEISKEGRPGDRSLYPGATGLGRWSEAIYYHVLNCGFRIPPAAGSGSGTNESPVGTNRVYVHVGEEFTKEAFWDWFNSGRVFVTNGPLLRCKANGELPGHVFGIDRHEAIQIEISLDLATRVPVEYLQIIKNGAVEAEVRLADFVNRKGRLPAITFRESGWFLVRAVTTNQKVYQFASSGPYYVEHAGKSRISSRSVYFFLEWLAALEAQIRDSRSIDEESRKSLLAEQELAQTFFKDLLLEANAE